MEHTLKQHNTARWNPPVYPAFSTNKQNAVIC